MANDIGINIKLDGAPEYANSMKQMAAQTKEFKSQLDMTVSSFDKHTSAFSKSKAMTDAYKNQLGALKNQQAAVAEQIEKVSSSENANETYVTNLKAKYADLQTEINETQGKLNDLGGTLGAVGSQMQEAGEKISAVGDGMSQVGGTMTAAITTPIVGLGSVATKTFGDVDKQFRLVEQTMGDTKNSTQDFTDLWDEMSRSAKNSVFTMQDASDALLNYARQGFNAKEAQSMLNPALSLAAGTGTELATVTSGLGNTMKAFGAEAKDTAAYADILAKAQAQANTDTTNLFEAMSVAAPICRTVGWDVKDLATITDLFGDAGISGSEGANALKTGLARLAAPAKSGAESMKKLGLETGEAYAIFDDNGSMKDMQTVLKNLKGAFSGLTEQEKLEAASNIFGKNQMAKWLVLVDSATETVSEYRENLDECTGSADSMADALLSGVGGSLERVSSTFDVFKTTIGNDIKEPVQEGAECLIDLMNGFMDLDEETRKNIEQWTAVAAAVGPVLLIGGKLTTGIGNLITATGTITKAIGTATTTFGGLGSAISAGVTSPIGTAAIGIAGFVAAFKGINAAINATDPYFEQYKTEISGLKSETDGAKDSVGQLIENIRKQADNVAETGSTLGVWKDKLNECFDAQGKLKNGCESTAKYILGELNEAMGTSYSISAEGFIENTNNEKVSLEQLNDEINKTIEQMKRKALQEAVESQYTAALTDQKEAVKALNDAVKEYNDALAGGSKKMGDYSTAVANAANAVGSANETLAGLSHTMDMMADTSTYSAQECEQSFATIANSAANAGSAAELSANVAMGAAINTATGWNDNANMIEMANGRVIESSQTVASVAQKAADDTYVGWQKIPEGAAEAEASYKQATDRVSEDTKAMQRNVTEASGKASGDFGDATGKMSSDMKDAQKIISDNINKAKDNMSSGVSAMEKKVSGAKWSWPHLKLPHVNVSGEFDLFAGKVPTISVDWYAKAMQGGMILNSPTIFGGMNGKLLGAGEAGPEVVVGASSLSQLVTNAVEAGGGRTVVINVYGAEGQSVEELAEIIADKIGGDVESREAVFR